MSQDAEISIGRVKRDISELVNRVAYGGERIVLTSRGKPKAVIVSLDDYERLRAGESQSRQAEWEAWARQRDRLVAQILERRGGEHIDIEAFWSEFLDEREARDDQILGH